MSRRILTVWVLVTALVVSGCQTTTLGTREHLWTDSENRRILLMPADIELSILNAGGVTEPNAAWTETAQKLAFAALKEQMGEKDATLVVYDADKADPNPDSDEVQLSKLHQAVGSSILIHKFIPILSLPTKKETFDWGLGPAVATLREKHDADYGLFVFIRDSYTSGGRAAVIFIAAVLGAGVQGGTQVGFASLVDLKSGEIVWFNRLARQQGDMRNEKGANETIATLLDNFPK